MWVKFFMRKIIALSLVAVLVLSGSFSTSPALAYDKYSDGADAYISEGSNIQEDNNATDVYSAAPSETYEEEDATNHLPPEITDEDGEENNAEEPNDGEPNDTEENYNGDGEQDEISDSGEYENPQEPESPEDLEDEDYDYDYGAGFESEETAEYDLFSGRYASALPVSGVTGIYCPQSPNTPEELRLPGLSQIALFFAVDFSFGAITLESQNGVIISASESEWQVNVEVGDFKDSYNETTLLGFSLNLIPDAVPVGDSNVQFFNVEYLHAGGSAVIAEGGPGVFGSNFNATLRIPAGTATPGNAATTITWMFVPSVS